MSAPMTGEQRVRHPAQARFHAALRPLLVSGPPTELFPSALAEAARESLDADAAGLSIFAEHRVPIGASDAEAALAERLQFTVGSGPCLSAVVDHGPVRADDDQIAAEWPVYHQQLRRETRFAAIVASPFSLPTGVQAALDVYFVHPAMPRFQVLADAGEVAVAIGDLLALADPDVAVDAAELPAWVQGVQGRRRLRVWIAIGMLVTELRLGMDDALARLRAAAFARGEDVDRLAERIVEGDVRPRDLEAG